MLSYMFSIILKNIIFIFLNVGVLINIWHINQGVVTKIQIYKYISIFGTNAILKEIKYEIKRDQIFVRK